jgi:hypothetical protein
VCSAGLGTASNKLLYQPVTGTDPHPYTPEKLLKPKKVIDRKKSVMIKKARKKETFVLQDIANIAGVEFKPTINSGAINGDGDGKIGPISVDHKYRTTAKSFTVSRSEWEKGLLQKVEAWVVTIPNPQYIEEEDTAVVMTKAAFIKLLRLIEK